MFQNVDFGTQTADLCFLLKVDLLELSDVFFVGLFGLLNVVGFLEPLRDLGSHPNVFLPRDGEAAAESLDLGGKLAVFLFKRVNLLLELGSLFAQLVEISFVFLNVFLQVLVLRLSLLSEPFRRPF